VKIKTNIDFLKYRKYTFIGSAIIIILGIIFYILNGGFNLGLDFQGGIRATIQIESEENIKKSDIKSLLAAELPDIEVAEITTEENMFEITYKASAIKERQDIDQEEQQVEEELEERVDEVEVVEEGEVVEETETQDEDTTTEPMEETEEEPALDEEDTEEPTEGIELLREIDITEIINQQVLPTLRERYGEGVIIRYIGDEEEPADEIETIVNDTAEKVEGLSLNLKEIEDNKYIFKPAELPENYLLDDFVSMLNQTDLGVKNNYEISQVVTAVQVDSFEPTVGQDIQNIAWAVAGLIILLILGYLALRFQFKFGVAAVLAVVHDSLIILSILAITGFEVGIQTVTAVLTIIGYSLNDTIVVFDRIRENSENIKKEEYMLVINKSINEVIGRTIITSVTTLLAVGSLLVFGGPAIFELAFSITIGIVVGTYSSIFIASPVLIIWENFLHDFHDKKHKEKDQLFLRDIRKTRNRWALLLGIAAICAIIAFIIVFPNQGIISIIIGIPAILLILLGVVLSLEVMKTKVWARILLTILNILIVGASVILAVLMIPSALSNWSSVLFVGLALVLVIIGGVMLFKILLFNKGLNNAFAQRTKK
jgi:preprotein translocase SecF subunit